VIIWVDAQLSPAIAPWLATTFGVEAYALRDLGLRDSTDREIYLAARDAGAVVMTKDSDFVQLQAHFGPPPKVIWLRCGNTSNARLKEILVAAFSDTRRLLEGPEDLVEVTAT
jgi:predicted nuclease of predicted toxin-antitoxin system